MHEELDEKRFAEAQARDDGLGKKLDNLEKQFHDHAKETNDALEKAQKMLDALAAKAAELEKDVKQAQNDASSASAAAAAAQHDINEHVKTPHFANVTSAPIEREAVKEKGSAAPTDKAILDRIAALEKRLTQYNGRSSVCFVLLKAHRLNVT